MSPLHGLLFFVKQQGFFYKHHPTHKIAHTTASVTPFKWSTGLNEKWSIGSTMKDRSYNSSHRELMLYQGATSHFLLPVKKSPTISPIIASHYLVLLVSPVLFEPNDGEAREIINISILRLRE